MKGARGVVLGRGQGGARVGGAHGDGPWMHRSGVRGGWGGDGAGQGPAGTTSSRMTELSRKRNKGKNIPDGDNSISTCNGLNCVPQNFISCSPNPQHLRMCLYVEIGSL